MKVFYAFAALLLLMGCQMQPFSVRTTPDPVLVIRGGSSFGECAGYCWNEIQINPEQTRLIRKFQLPAVGPSAPDRLYQRLTDPADWNGLVALVEFDELQTLESVYGCPDCADGGAEWIEVETATGKKKITFEFGSSVAGAEALIEAVRAFREAYIESVQ